LCVKGRKGSRKRWARNYEAAKSKKVVAAKALANERKVLHIKKKKGLTKEGVKEN